MSNKKVGILVDYDFAKKNDPPYPHPIFLSYENPLRIKRILDHLEDVNLWERKEIVKLIPQVIGEEILSLAHSQYHIQTIKSLSEFGNGLMGEEVFITRETYDLAKKAVGGTIKAVKSVLDEEVNYSLALVRPPGHHALREKASGLCIFNNIATTIFYLREKLNFKGKIAIVDIDDHFGDGIARYFYEDPSVLYFSIHEFDFMEGEIGFINELGAKEGLGTSINFPIPIHSSEEIFFEGMEILRPVLREFNPDIILVALGFDMYFNDPVGNCLLTSSSYYRFTKEIMQLAKDLCDGRLSFILEGGYSLIGLPICTHAVIKALQGLEHHPYFFEKIQLPKYTKQNKEDITRIKESLQRLLKNHWNSV